MRTVSEPEPRCMSAEAEARQDILADGALVVREYVRWEDVHEEGKVLHGTHCIRKKVSVWFIEMAHGSGRVVFSPNMPYMSTLCAVKGRSSQRTTRLSENGWSALSQTRRYLRMAFIVLFHLRAPSQVPASIHRSPAMVPLVLPVRKSTNQTAIVDQPEIRLGQRETQPTYERNHYEVPGTLL